MQDLSLHILDLVQNSIAADADLIQIIMDDQPGTGQLTISILDNGRGMDIDEAAKALDPFYTTRTTRRVGMGIPLFKASAEATGGRLYLNSQRGKGTVIKAYFNKDHIDCLPLGRIEDTLVTLVLCNPHIDFVYLHQFGKRDFTLDTKQVKEQLNGVPIEHPEVINWIKAFIEESLNELLEVLEQ